VRTDLAALAISLAAISAACSSSSGPAGPNTGPSSSGGDNGGSSSGGAAGDDGGSSGSVSSSGSGSGSGSGSSGGGTSSSGGHASSSSGSSGSSGADGSVTAAAYPSGPYCSPASGNPPHIAPGCVLPDKSWIGYDDEAANVLATTEPYATYSLGQVFADAQRSGKRYAMLNLAEFDCPGCQKSAGELSAVGDGGVSAGAAVVQAGGVVIELLETAGFADVPSQAQLEAWVSDPSTSPPHALYVTSVEDPGTAGTTPSPSLAFFGQREQAYIIDLSTMKILQYINGDITGFGATSGGLAMTAMHQLLGK